MKGTLLVFPLHASLTINTRIILSMSPFCIFTMDSQTGTTRPCKNGGKRPSWPNQSIELQKRETGFRNFTLTIELVDEQLWQDEAIGMAEVQVDRELDVAKKGRSQVVASIIRKGERVGEMLIELDWEPVPVSMHSLPAKGYSDYQGYANIGRNSMPNEKERQPPIDPRRANAYNQRGGTPIANPYEPSKKPYSQQQIPQVQQPYQQSPYQQQNRKQSQQQYVQSRQYQEPALQQKPKQPALAYQQAQLPKFQTGLYYQPQSQQQLNSKQPQPQNEYRRQFTADKMDELLGD